MGAATACVAPAASLAHHNATDQGESGTVTRRVARWRAARPGNGQTGRPGFMPHLVNINPIARAGRAAPPAQTETTLSFLLVAARSP